MIREINYSESMSKRNDLELVKIVTTDRNNYDPLAIIAAEDEIKKRNIDITNIKSIKEEVDSSLRRNQIIDSTLIGQGIRFLHFIIDYFAVAIISIFIFNITLLLFSITDTIQYRQQIYLFFLISYLCYYIIMEFVFKKTISKFITKSSVVKIDGSQLEFSDVLIRSFSRIIPFDPLFILFTNNGLHDRFSKTAVVKDKYL